MVVSETSENSNTCNGYIWNLHKKYPNKISKPYRGLFILKEMEKNLKDFVECEQNFEQKTNIKFNEENIYQPAIDYLLSRDECTHAIMVGGNIFGKKWGTPDILGAIRASSDAVYRPPLEIIAVEI